MSSFWRTPTWVRLASRTLVSRSPEAADRLDHADQVVLDVAEVLAQLAVHPGDQAVGQSVQRLGERGGGLMELDHLPLRR